jgi:hypothetical protein
MLYMGRYVRSLCHCRRFPSSSGDSVFPLQSTPVPPISIDLEPKGLYNASRCAYIINVRPFQRREGNYAWATFSALAVSLDNRSVESLTGRSPYYSFYNVPRISRVPYFGVLLTVRTQIVLDFEVLVS